MRDMHAWDHATSLHVGARGTYVTHARFRGAEHNSVKNIVSSLSLQKSVAGCKSRRLHLLRRHHSRESACLRAAQYSRILLCRISFTDILYSKFNPHQ